MRSFFAFIIFSLILGATTACGSEDNSEYKESVEEVMDEMLENAARAERVLNKYSDVWSFSIESGSPVSVESMALTTGLDVEDVNEYFIINNAGNVTNDFSSNIHSMVAYYEDTGEISKISTSSNSIKDAISELNNPPEEFEKIYDEILNMYDLVREFTSLAENPKGNLREFNSKVSELSSEIVNKYNRLEVMLPEDD